MLYDISDNELIYLYRNNNYQAFKLLNDRYKKRIYGLILKLTSKYNLKCNFDDYYSICYIAFIKCIKRFDDQYIFYSYSMQAIENVINREIEKEIKKEKIALLDTDLINDGYPYSDCVCDSGSEYEVNEMNEYLINNFDSLTNRIIALKIEGYSSLQIARKLHTSSKVIYNRLDKVKKGLKNTFYN